MNPHPSTKPMVAACLPADAKPVDRDLAAALEELLRSPHADSECCDPARPIVMEIAFWIGLGAMLWVLAALLS